MEIGHYGCGRGHLEYVLNLLELDFDVVYRPGVKHKAANDLSNVPMTAVDKSPL